MPSTAEMGFPSDMGPITADIAPPPPETGQPTLEDLENSFSKMGLSAPHVDPSSIDNGRTSFQTEPVTPGAPPTMPTGASVASNGRMFVWIPDMTKPPPPLAQINAVGTPLTVRSLTTPPVRYPTNNMMAPMPAMGPPMGPPVVTMAPQHAASGSHVRWPMPVMGPPLTVGRLPMPSMQPAMRFPMQTPTAVMQVPPVPAISLPPAMGSLTPVMGSSQQYSLYDKLKEYRLTKDQLWENNYVKVNQDGKWTVKPALRQADKPAQIQNPNDHRCVRCRQTFQMGPDKKVFIPENTWPCANHPGKLRQKEGTGPKYWTCCDKKKHSQSCKTYRVHVHTDNIIYGELSEKENGKVYPVGFKSAQAQSNAIPNVVALDCEMIYTAGGCELAKVTLLDEDLKPLLDTYVQPINQIIDYNTMFSGITEKDVSQAPEVTPKYPTLAQVQQQLFQHIHADTIIVGHSLENDLKALRIVHSNVVDTAVVFKHNNYKRSLKDLAKENLGMEIRKEKDSGHDSKEDAYVTLSLMRRKLGLM